MEMVKKNVGGAEFTFYVWSRDNRSGFVHECELWMNDEQLAHKKAQYYNRTWECYRFQSVMLSCVDSVIEQVRQSITEEEKERRGWQRLTQARKNEIGEIVRQNISYKVLRDLRGQVSGAKYGTEDERRELEFLDAMNAMLQVLFGRANENGSPAA